MTSEHRRPPRLPRTLAGAAAGLVADRLFGEPPPAAHPVAIFGSTMSRLESRLFQDSRRRGTAYAATGLGLGVAAGALGGRSFLGTAAATYVSVAGRGLAEAAREVQGALAAGDLGLARAALPALVGREPAGLDETEIVRAVIESVAENTVDAIIAPALWGALGGAPATLGYRALNTLDAMVGHHSDRYEHFGWASARLDDAANYIPARVGALAVMACRPRRAAAVWRAVRHDAADHPSPNAGVAEAAFAAALDLRLGGSNRYGDRLEARGTLGTGRAPGTLDIGRAIQLSRDTTLTLIAGLALGAIGFAVPTTRRRAGRPPTPAAP